MIHIPFFLGHLAILLLDYMFFGRVFLERCCSDCLSEARKQEDGCTENKYFHKVLEVKQVIGEKLVLNLMVKSIKNEKGDLIK